MGENIVSLAHSRPFVSIRGFPIQKKAAIASCLLFDSNHEPASLGLGEARRLPNRGPLNLRIRISHFVVEVVPLVRYRFAIVRLSLSAGQATDPNHEPENWDSSTLGSCRRNASFNRV